jgi:hypothetical protein
MANEHLQHKRYMAKLLRPATAPYRRPATLTCAKQSGRSCSWKPVARTEGGEVYRKSLVYLPQSADNNLGNLFVT